MNYSVQHGGSGAELRSSKESQPKYCNIDDGLPLTTVCVVPVAVAGCWLAGRLQSFIVDGSSALNCFYTVNVRVSVRGPN